MNTTPPRPTPETDAEVKDFDAPWLYYVNADFARKLERERDEAREQIASCAINTNVRLFDLVRYMRASLHEDGLITDEEYWWLCGGCEMANSPEGGSPSPRRLEDYDVLSDQLKAMREVIEDVNKILLSIQRNDIFEETMRNHATCALTKLQTFIKLTHTA